MLRLTHADMEALAKEARARDADQDPSS